jgi:hypothetical protein
MGASRAPTSLSDGGLGEFDLTPRRQASRASRRARHDERRIDRRRRATSATEASDQQRRTPHRSSERGSCGERPRQRCAQRLRRDARTARVRGVARAGDLLSEMARAMHIERAASPVWRRGTAIDVDGHGRISRDRNVCPLRYTAGAWIHERLLLRGL